MKEKIKRDRSIQVRLSEEEYEAFERKFRNSCMKSRSAFFRAMIFEGCIVKMFRKKPSLTERLSKEGAERELLRTLCLFFLLDVPPQQRQQPDCQPDE